MRGRLRDSPRVFAIVTAATATAPAFSVGCGGSVTDRSEHAGDTSAGDHDDEAIDAASRDVPADASDSTASDDTCRAAGAVDSTPGCPDYLVPIAGDPLTCSDCIALCGRAISCRYDEDAGAIRCTPPLCPRDATVD